MAHDVYLSVSVETIGDSTTIRPIGEIDIGSVSMLGDSLRRALEWRQGKSITLDLTRVSFIDCGGLRALVLANRWARRNGSRLRIKCGDAVSRLIEMTQVRIACD